MKQEPARGFYRARPQGFIAPDGSDYRVTGVNLWYGMYLGSPGPGGDRPRLVRELDTLKAQGVNNIRALAGGEASDLEGVIGPALIRAPGVYDADLLAGLDFLMARLGERNMTAVLYLGNFWHWSGGFTRWIVWADQEHESAKAGTTGALREQEGRGGLDCSTDLADPNKPANRYQNCADSFYRNTGAMELFGKHVRFMVGRMNGETRRAYRDEPALFSWQLANEPRGGEGSPRRGDYACFDQWVHKTAGLIKSIDHNHMVSTGNEGAIGCADLLEPWIRAHSSPHVDYLTAHIWPKNWGWWKNPDPAGPDFAPALELVIKNTLDYLEQHLEAAKSLGKPLVLEEFGLGRDYEHCAPGSPCTARDRYFSAVFDAMGRWHREGRGMAGFNIWSWGGECRPPRPEGSKSVWQKGDPPCGDPPQEPQGLNSVFDCDLSTLEVIRKAGSIRPAAGDGDRA